MSTCFIFPGLNGLLRRSDRNRYRNLPEVKNYMARAEAALEERLNLSVDLNELLDGETKDIYHIDNISLSAVIISSIQSGVAEHLIEKKGLRPEWVMGCSLGDIARAVTAGVYNFEDAVVNHVYFTKSIDGIDKIGRNIGVATLKGIEFQQEDFDWFDEIEVDVSHLTPRFLNIGGRFADLEKVEKRAKEKRWMVMPILEYPAHSRYILPYVEKVRDEFGGISMNQDGNHIRIFSSFSCQELVDMENIKREFLLSITQTIHWYKAVQELVAEKGVTKFINIGPCHSLSRMMKDIDIEIECVEAQSFMDLIS